MTYKEWMIENNPGYVNDNCDGGVHDCPYYYGIDSEKESGKNCEYNGGKGCEYCWNREMSDGGGEQDGRAEN